MTGNLSPRQLLFIKVAGPLGHLNFLNPPALLADKVVVVLVSTVRAGELNGPAVTPLSNLNQTELLKLLQVAINCVVRYPRVKLTHLAVDHRDIQIVIRLVNQQIN